MKISPLSACVSSSSQTSSALAIGAMRVAPSPCWSGSLLFGGVQRAFRWVWAQTHGFSSAMMEYRCDTVYTHVTETNETKLLTSLFQIYLIYLLSRLLEIDFTHTMQSCANASYQLQLWKCFVFLFFSSLCCPRSGGGTWRGARRCGSSSSPSSAPSSAIPTLSLSGKIKLILFLYHWRSRDFNFTTDTLQCTPP